jgi:hypothetical protein
MIPILRSLLALSLALPLFGAPVITEFLAVNSAGLSDQDGDRSDWIEIHNPDATSIDMAGWTLTDDPANPTKWTFPSVVIPSGEYLIVFASGKSRTSQSPHP